MEFSRQEYCSGLPLPTPEDLPNPGVKPTSLMSPALAGRFFTTSATWEALYLIYRWETIHIPLLLLLLIACRVQLVRPHRWQPTRLPRPWDSPAGTLEWLAIYQ